MHTSLLVLDEYDKSLELGFAEEMKRIVRSMQSVGFMVLTSATALAEYPDFLKLKSPLLLDYSSDSAGVPRLDIRKVKSPVADKLDTLAEVEVPAVDMVEKASGSAHHHIRHRAFQRTRLVEH